MRILKWTLIALLALFLVLLLVTMLDRGVTFTLTCVESGPLRAGDPLVLDGEEIGGVVLVVPRRDRPDEIVVRIATRHRARAHQGLRFRLAARPGGGGYFVEIRETEEGSENAILKGQVRPAEPLPGWPSTEPGP